MAALRLCSILGCDNRAVARGWCHNHHYRWRKHGDPLGGSTVRGEPLRWIKRHVDHVGEDCLLWPYSGNGHGYGQVNVDGRPAQSVHRFMCALAHGDPPTSEHQCAHSCGKGHLGCVNPRHLRWATPAENNADKVDHGTIPRGERTPQAKLTEDDVRAIRKLLLTQSQRSIATMFGVSRPAIQMIANGRNWGWLE